jgi:phage terminase large subunit GpA-like protein
MCIQIASHRAAAAGRLSRLGRRQHRLHQARVPFPGPYNRRNFPYFDEILRALSPDDPCRIVTLKGSAQIGKTVIGNIFVGGSMAWIRATSCSRASDRGERAALVEAEAAPMLRGTPVAQPLFPEGSRDGAIRPLKEHATASARS